MRALFNVPLFPAAWIMLLVSLPMLLQLSNTPITLFGVGTLTGWLGCGALAASLVLMVREPAYAARMGGLERMYRWHHYLGVLGYVLLLAHPLFLAGQTLRTDPQLAWQIISTGTHTWSNILGWGGLLGLMIGLGATFVVCLRYSVWRFLHVLLSVGVLLGIGHVLLIDGFSFSAWLVIIPMLAALSWRLVRVDRSWGGQPYEVSAAACLSNDVLEVTLRPLTRPLTAAPGQFVMAAFFEGPHYHGCGEYHPYTVSGATPDGGLRLTIKALGDCTRALQRLEVGVAARIQGPFGGFFASRIASPELWIAGGIGVTPFLALLRLGEVTQPTEFIYVYRAAKDACYLNEMESYATAHPILHFQALVLQNDLAQLFSQLEKVSGLTTRQAYLCGPQPFVAAIRAWLAQRGVSEQAIHFEGFDFRS